MKKVLVLSLSLMMIAGVAFAYDYPSTNQDNREAEGPHVNLVEAGMDYVELEFVNPESYLACFEYRSDGDVEPVIDEDHYNPDIDDALYPYVCVNDGVESKVIEAEEYVEARLTFGAERDWDFDWTPFYVKAGIVSPEEEEVIYTNEELALVARDFEAADGGVQWAVRKGTCAAGTDTVAGNVDGYSDDFNWEEGVFTSQLDIFEWEASDYCFVFNPRNGGRYTRNFYIEEFNPESKNQCKKGGWEEFGFRNQGQCIRFVNTGQDSR
jgi:hypothetical protein